jgi:hypothetical protein
LAALSLLRFRPPCTVRANAIWKENRYVHYVLVTQGCYCALCARGEPQHVVIARKDFRDKPAHTAAHGVFLKARLQRGAKTSPLKLRRNHEGHLGEIGRRTQKVAGAADDFLVFAWPGYA